MVTRLKHHKKCSCKLTSGSDTSPVFLMWCLWTWGENMDTANVNKHSSSYRPALPPPRHNCQSLSSLLASQGLCCLCKQSHFCLGSLIPMTGGLDKVRRESYLETLKSYMSKGIIFSVFKPNPYQGAIWDKHSHAMFWVSVNSTCASCRIAHNGSCWFLFSLSCSGSH